MTGEITLRGKVLAVGSIRDKVLAAHRAGCKRIAMPRDNGNDLQDIPEEIRRELEFLLVSHVDEVLNAALHPARFRAALASGTVDVAAQSRDAASMDGPAFHRAADALAQARRGGLSFAIAIEGAPQEVVHLVQAAARLHEAISSSWTAREAEAVHVYRLEGTQAAVARKLRITQQAVSDALLRARLSDLTFAEEAIRTWLQKEGTRG